jgi:hypothetical protein
MAGELISREALERIIQRAAELQAGERDIGEGLTKDEVLALGKDVGIPNRYLHQALLEEQTRTIGDTQRGFWAWLTGPRGLSAQRVVPGDRATVERALTRWMEDEESLQVKRRYPERTTWEPKAGAFASIQRALGAKGRRFALAGAEEITGQVTQLEPGFCHVALSADVRPRRARRVQGGGVVFALGAVSLTAFTLALGALGLLPGVVLFPTAMAIARSHRGDNERILVSMEQVLDRLEHSEIRGGGQSLPGPHPFVRIAEEVRKVFENPRPRPRS